MGERPYVTLERVLGVTVKMARHWGLDDDALQRARVRAWLYWRKYDGCVSPVAVGVWARREAARGLGAPGACTARSAQTLNTFSAAPELVVYDRHQFERDLVNRDWVEAILAHADERDQLVARDLMVTGGVVETCRRLRMGRHRVRAACFRLRLLAARLGS